MVDQAIITLSGPDYALTMIVLQRNAAKPVEPMLKEVIQGVRDKFEFRIKDDPKNDKKGSC